MYGTTATDTTANGVMTKNTATVFVNILAAILMRDIGKKANGMAQES